MAEAPRAIPAPATEQLLGAPAPTPEQRNKLFDLRRDLQAVAAGEPSALDDLASDLVGLTDPAPDQALVRRLVQSAAQALRGTSPSDASAERLAMAYYVALHAAGMGSANLTALRSELAAAFGDAGTPAGVATASARLIASR
ncbi:MAG: hypothetical protein AB1635_01130 [Acidobacteriota bacterium]